MFVMWHIAPILRFFGQQEHLIALVQSYFNALAWSIIPSIGVMCCSQFVIAVGKPRIVLFWGVLRLLLMLLPGYALLFGIGYPISVQFAAELSAFVLVTVFYGWLGQTSLATWIIGISMGFLIGVLVGAIILLRRFYGNKAVMS